MNKHTATPWHVAAGSTGRHRSPTIEVHASVDGLLQSVATVTGISAGHANAAHIVRCVNLHDELVEALALCFKYVNGGSDLYPGLHHEAFTAARAALAKAKEGA
jgi:hypothetical protein